MTRVNFESAIQSLNESLNKLEEALRLLDEKKSDQVHLNAYEDALIKRFEVAFEYCWKFIKIAVEYNGKDAYGPRPAIQEAVRFGWISNPEFWAEALDARNSSVHDYFGISRSVYIKIIKKFITESIDVRDQITKLFEK